MSWAEAVCLALIPATALTFSMTWVVNEAKKLNEDDHEE